MFGEKHKTKTIIQKGTKVNGRGLYKLEVKLI